MSAIFGQVGHVLTNLETTAFDHTWQCVSASGSSVTDWNLLYRLTAHVASQLNIYDFKFANGTWQDVGPNAPNDFGTSATDSTIVVPDISHQYLHLWGNLTATGFVCSLENDGYIASGPSVSQSRSAHNGTVTENLDNTLSAPNPGIFYEKTGQHRFQIKYFDQTDSITGYNVTVAWQTSSGTVSDTQSVSTASGDLQLTYNFSANDASDQPVTGAITVSFDINMYYNGTEYVAGNTVLTFQYYSVGPYAASFSPATGIPGQPISVNIADNNPYPDENSTLQFEQTPGGSLISATLSNANNYSLSLNQAFTSEVGTYKIYDSDNNVIATATYTDAPQQNGGGSNYDDRFPLITTNLFNRQRSVYAIGMTHKDTWDLFL